MITTRSGVLSFSVIVHIGDTLIELNASDGSLVQVVQPGSLNFECSGIAFDGTHLWMTNNTGQSVTEYPVT